MKQLLVKAVLHRGVLFGAVWLTLTGAAADSLILGMIVVCAAVWMSLHLLPATHPLVLWRLALHLPRFITGSVRGGLDVAFRAFSPDMRLDPGWRKMSSTLPDGARVALGAELSLMPGTLSAGSMGDTLLVHMLDVKATQHGAIRQEEDEIAAMIGVTRKSAAPTTQVEPGQNDKRATRS